MRPGARVWLKTALVEGEIRHRVTVEILRAGVYREIDSLGGFMANYCTLTNLMNNTGASSAATCALYS